MRQRPVACLVLLIFLVLSVLPAGLFYKPSQLTGKQTGQVVGEVGRRIRQEDQTQLDLYHCQIQTEGKTFKVNHLLLYLTGTTEAPVGAVLSLSGTIYPVTEPTNPGQFNSRLYYEGRGITYRVYADEAHIISGQIHPIREMLVRIREKLEDVYDAVFEETDASVLKAMILGQKSDLSEEVKELYQKNGISHVLAISGLHISLVGLGLYRILRRLTGSYAASGIPSILLIAAYCWMTGASVSAVRASIMSCLVIAADLLGRTPDTLTSLGVAALILMIGNPLAAKQSAFLLSFGAVLALALVSPIWKLYKPKQGKLFASFSTGICVLLVTFPLLLANFFEYPLYSTLLNLLVIPLMSVLMTDGILCGVLGIFWIRGARAVGIPCHLILWLYQKAGAFCMKLPASVLHIGEPKAWKILLYYAMLSAVLLVLYKEKRRKKYWRKKEPFHPKKRLIAMGAGLMLLGISVLCLRSHQGLTITMLDVGQGDGIFFQDPEGHTYLCDGGSSNVTDVGAYRILPFLKTQGIRELDYLMISHMDQDHISGIRELLEECRKDGSIRINQALLPDVKEKDDTYMEIVEMMQEADVKIQYLSVGDVLSDGTFTMTCLWPNREKVLDDRNELSLTMLMEYGDFQMLLTGDDGEEAEQNLVALGKLKEVEVLKVAHHGSKYSSGDAFLEKVHPQLGLISCSATNRYGHPGQATLERLSAQGTKVLITKDYGAIRIQTDGKTFRVQTYVN
jgi:competence protein ComEC